MGVIAEAWAEQQEQLNSHHKAIEHLMKNVKELGKYQGIMEFMQSTLETIKTMLFQMSDNQEVLQKGLASSVDVQIQLNRQVLDAQDNVRTLSRKYIEAMDIITEQGKTIEELRSALYATNERIGELETFDDYGNKIRP